MSSKEEITVADVKPPKKKRRTKSKKVVVAPPCWEVCEKVVTKDGTDYVHICLGDSFVTLMELTRMMNGELSTQKENVGQ